MKLVGCPFPSTVKDATALMILMFVAFVVLTANEQEDGVTKFPTTSTIGAGRRGLNQENTQKDALMMVCSAG